MFVVCVHCFTDKPLTLFLEKIRKHNSSFRSRSSLVVESLSLMREAWVRSSAAPTKALEQGLNLHLLLGPYLDGAPACLN